MELFRALGAYSERPSIALASALDLPLPSPADESALFAFQLYPYASVYTGSEGMLGGEARDRVAGFWRALRLVPPPEPDHLAVLLALYAACAEQNGERARVARHALLWEHLLSWLPPWLARLNEVGPEPYRAWGALLREALVREAEDLGPPSTMPLHLREAKPGEGLATVLAAVRSGLLITRADLARAAAELGLGLRHGERAYALEALLAQDPAGVARWLSREASRQAALYRSFPAAWSRIGGYWSRRAERTSRQLAAP